MRRQTAPSPRQERTARRLTMLKPFIAGIAATFMAAGLASGTVQAQHGGRGGGHVGGGGHAGSARGAVPHVGHAHSGFNYGGHSVYSPRPTNYGHSSNRYPAY